jgi:cytochrome c-type biogenesis protein CcmF
MYVNLMAFDRNGAHATVKLIVEPLVPWIWFGGLVMVIGAVIGMFHGPRPRKPAPASVAPAAAAPERVEPAEAVGAGL